MTTPLSDFPSKSISSARNLRRVTTRPHQSCIARMVQTMGSLGGRPRVQRRGWGPGRAGGVHEPLPVYSSTSRSFGHTERAAFADAVPIVGMPADAITALRSRHTDCFSAVCAVSRGGGVRDDEVRSPGRAMPGVVDKKRCEDTGGHNSDLKWVPSLESRSTRPVPRTRQRQYLAASGCSRCCWRRWSLRRHGVHVVSADLTFAVRPHARRHAGADRRTSSRSVAFLVASAIV